MSLIANTLPPNVQVGDVISVLMDTGVLEKGRHYYVLDRDTREVAPLGGDKLPEDILYEDDVQTTLDGTAHGNPVSLGAVVSTLLEYSKVGHGHTIDDVDGVVPITKGGTGVTSLPDLMGLLGIEDLDFPRTIFSSNNYTGGLTGNNLPLDKGLVDVQVNGVSLDAMDYTLDTGRISIDVSDKPSHLKIVLLKKR